MRLRDQGSSIDQRLRVVYYPFSRCLDATSLKRLVLLFDEIWFVEPLAEDIVESPMVFRWAKPDTRMLKHFPASGQGPAVSVDGLENAILYQLRDWYNIEPLYARLHDKGIVKFFNPAAIVKRHDKLLTQAAIADSVDRDFRPFARQERQGDSVVYSKWLLYQNRIPPSLREHREVLAFSTEFPSAQAVAGLTVAELQEKDEGFQYEYEGEKLEDYDSRLIKANLNLIRRNLESRRAVPLPFRLGLSLTINQALLISEEENVIPVTDAPLMHELLVKKYKRAFSSREEAVREIVASRTPAERYKFELLSLNVAERIVPRSELSRRSIEEVIKYRENCKADLMRFREFIWSLTHDIESQPWDSRFRREILKILDKKIVPEVRKLSDQMESAYEKMFGRIVAKTGKAALKAVAGGLPPLVVAAMFGLSPGLALALSSSVALSIGVLSLPELVTYWQDKKSARRNSVAYLAKF